MDIKGLKYFITAAENLNFTRAAKICFITQTAMSQHISKMEEELGFNLFERSNRKVKLTPAGQYFYEQACQLIEIYEEAVQNGMDISLGNKGRFIILCPSYVDGQLLMPVVQKFQSQYPTVEIKIKIGDIKHFYQQLTQKKCTVVFCQPYDLVAYPELEMVRIADFHSHVYARYSHHLFNQPFITPQDLAKENCVMLEPRRFPNGYRHMRNSWVEAGFEPKRVIKVHTFEDIFLTLESENAISIMPSFIKKFVSKDIQSAPIHTEKPLLMDLCGFYLKDETNPMIQNFMNELKHYIEEKMEQ